MSTWRYIKTVLGVIKTVLGVHKKQQKYIEDSRESSAKANNDTFHKQALESWRELQEKKTRPPWREL